jgi:SnoaL-like domain
MTIADETIRTMRAAGEAGDVDAFLATLADDVMLRSPITDRIEFRGREEMRELMEAVFATLQDIRYYEELGDDRSRALFYRARIGKQQLEEATLVRLDEAGKIKEFTIWFRPMPGLTRLTAGLAPRLARRRSRRNGRIVSAATGPLAFITAAADGVLVKLVTGRKT